MIRLLPQIIFLPLFIHHMMRLFRDKRHTSSSSCALRPGHTFYACSTFTKDATHAYAQPCALRPGHTFYGRSTFTKDATHAHLQPEASSRPLNASLQYHERGCKTRRNTKLTYSFSSPYPQGWFLHIPVVTLAFTFSTVVQSLSVAFTSDTNPVRSISSIQHSCL